MTNKHKKMSEKPMLRGMACLVLGALLSTLPVKQADAMTVIDPAAIAIIVHRGDGQAVDIIAAAGEQPDDAREHARLVLHQHGNRGGTLRGINRRCHLDLP